MDNPIAEIKDVVRSITEPYEASTIAKNVEKYFTRDAYILHPAFNQPHTSNGRDDLVGIYKMLRVLTIDNKIEFHAVMFNEDMTQGTIELTEYVTMRWSPISRYFSRRNRLHFLVRIDLRKCSDGKYRIWRQHDNLATDLAMCGVSDDIPGLSFVSNVIKSTLGVITGKLGRFLLTRGWLGP
ncbi:hypothetical protein DFH28DRAFT_1063814 [Melampsora americana]|nr:hypothetical protein DFH28DRAFT_1063814 [Melampsora americana]